jgi:GTP-binding protein HflX
VFNKLDVLDAACRPLQLEDSFDLAGVQTPRIFLSAKNSEGLQALRLQLANIVSGGVLPAKDAAYFPENREAAS